MMKKRQSGTIDLNQIKRGNFPGLVCSTACPVCHSPMTLDFGDCDNYLYYPEVGKEDFITFTCSTCEEQGNNPFEWEVPFKIIKAEIVIEYEIPTLKKRGMVFFLE